MTVNIIVTMTTTMTMIETTTVTIITTVNVNVTIRELKPPVVLVVTEANLFFFFLSKEWLQAPNKLSINLCK